MPSPQDVSFRGITTTRLSRPPGICPTVGGWCWIAASTARCSVGLGAYCWSAGTPAGLAAHRAIECAITHILALTQGEQTYRRAWVRGYRDNTSQPRPTVARRRP